MNIVCFITDDEPYVAGRIMAKMPVAKSLFDSTDGVEFTNYNVVTPRCGPSRAAMFFGLHGSDPRNGVIDNNGLLWNPATNHLTSLITALQAANMHTVLVGKYMNNWGNCVSETGCTKVPGGWERFVAFEDSEYFDFYLRIGTGPGSETTREAKYQTADTWGTGSDELPPAALTTDYSTDVLAYKAVKEIQDAPAGKDLFLWVAVTAPHPNITYPCRYSAAGCNGSGAFTPTIGSWDPDGCNCGDGDDCANKPVYVQQTGAYACPTSLSDHERAMRGVDDLIDSVRDAMVAAGRHDDTTYFYIADNGRILGEHKLEKKAAPYVAATHVSLWAHRTGIGQRTCGQLLANIDIAPTICALAGTSMPYALPMSGSFQAQMEGTSSAEIRDGLLLENLVDVDQIPVWRKLLKPSGRCLIQYPYGSLSTSGGTAGDFVGFEEEMYDLSVDPDELENLLSPGPEPGDADALRAELEALAPNFDNRIHQSSE